MKVSYLIIYEAVKNVLELTVSLIYSPIFLILLHLKHLNFVMDLQ